MAKKDLSSLVVKAQAGDRNALDQLMQESYETLFYYAYNTVKNEDLAADITQESCIEIINTLGKLRDPNAFRTWAGRIVYHKCAAHYRQTQDEVSLDADEEGQTILERLPDESRDSLPEQIQEDKEFKKVIWQMLDALPAEQRQAMMLYYFENMSVSEIAQIQNKTPGTVKSRLNYGRKAVIAQVEDYEKKTGTRLHSIAPLPLLLYFLFRENKEQTAKTAVVTLQKLGKTVSAPAAGVAARAAAGVAGKGLAVKLAAGIAAAAVVLGAVAGGIALSGNDSTDDAKHTDSQISDFGDGSEQHKHDYTTGYQIVPEGHQGICECGEIASAEAHSYEQGSCVCGSMQASEGLLINNRGSYCEVVGIGDCTDGNVVIPAYYEGIPVTVIGNSAFAHCQDITGVYIPETVTIIRQWAFYDCENLADVHFSDGLQKIENLAFIWCTSLTEIIFPDSLSEMGHSIFNECCNLKYVKLPASLRVLENGVFSNCDSLETVEFPGGLTSIGDKAFWHCLMLSELRFAGTKAQWTAVLKGYENTWKPNGTNWCSDTGEFVIICSDGVLSKYEA